MSKWVLYREAPLRPLYADGIGFQRPKQDDSRALWIFSSEDRARTMRKHLRHDSGGFVQCAKLNYIRSRMKEDYDYV